MRYARGQAPGRHPNRSQREVNHLQERCADSAQWKAEQQALTREVTKLRPELDHLRAQVATQADTLAEKLLLQRTLDSMQVDLELERRATQRTLAKVDDLRTHDDHMKTQLEALQAELAQDRKERQRLERDAQETTRESKRLHAAHESRVEALRTKLRQARDQLEETQGRANAQAASRRATGAALSPVGTKRSFATAEAQQVLGTPGIQPAAKRPKRGSTLPGNKSSFSITPFLNRAKDFRESIEPVAPREPTAEDFADGTAQRPPFVERMSGRDGLQAIREQAPQEELRGTAGDRNAPPDPSGTGTALATSIETEAPHLRAVASTAAAAEPRKKKKVLGSRLGQTLFDNEERDGASRQVKLGLPGALPGTRVRGLAQRKPNAFSLAGTGFSPLKRDRRNIVQAEA